MSEVVPTYPPPHPHASLASWGVPKKHSNVKTHQKSLRAMRSSKNWRTNYTLPETNTWHLKIGPGPKRKRSSSNHWYSGPKMLVSGRISAQFTFCGSKEFNALVVALAFWKSPGQNQITKNKAIWYFLSGLLQKETTKKKRFAKVVVSWPVLCL